MGKEEDTTEYEGKLKKMGASGPEDDEKWADGPYSDRNCTDIPCCLFFICFWIGFVIVTITGFATGNPELIGRGYDADGKFSSQSFQCFWCN